MLDSSTAVQLFPGGDALRHRIRFGDAASTQPWLTIVGIVANQHSPLGDDGANRPTVYRSTEQFPAAPSTMLVRTNTAAQYDVVPGLRRALAEVDHKVTIASVLSVEEALDKRIRPARFHATVIDGFALFVLVIACLGIFAAVSYAVSRRQREIAIKVALGAHSRDVIVDVVAQSVRTVAIGLVVGVVAAAAMGRLMRAVLYGSNPYDPTVYGAVLLVVMVAAAVAAYIPARRAVGIDPAQLMRAE
jgi:ABC-type antimicrobial peptide transport system permease subunit